MKKCEFYKCGICLDPKSPGIEDDSNSRSVFIKQARKGVRMTCRELAGALGVSVGRISDVEHGRENASAEFTAAVAMICAARLMVKKENK